MGGKADAEVVVDLGKGEARAESLHLLDNRLICLDGVFLLQVVDLLKVVVHEVRERVELVGTFIIAQEALLRQLLIAQARLHQHIIHTRAYVINNEILVVGLLTVATHTTLLRIPVG